MPLRPATLNVRLRATESGAGIKPGRRTSFIRSSEVDENYQFRAARPVRSVVGLHPDTHRDAERRGASLIEITDPVGFARPPHE